MFGRPKGPVRFRAGTGWTQGAASEVVQLPARYNIGERGASARAMSRMSQARNDTVTRESRRQLAELEALGYYHSIELPDGAVLNGFQSLATLRHRISQFPIPADLRGKRVLDIGAWDGWFTFEMERRGAQVMALDVIKNERFLRLRDFIGSKAEYVAGDICRLTSRDLGRFDIVLFLGVLYHLKHPVLALENVCDMTLDMACIESYVIDDGQNLAAPPVLEFYEGTELRGQFDNWVGPNVACLLAMARTAGFVEVEMESVVGERAHVTGRRHWSNPVGPGPGPVLLCVENGVSRDQEFSAKADDYVSLWFKTQQSGLNKTQVYPEIGGFATGPVQVTSNGGDGWHAVCKLPPGLDPGWCDVRVRVEGSGYSLPVSIPVDLSAAERKKELDESISPGLKIHLVTDGKSWDRWKVNLGPGACLSLWAQGIPVGCTSADLRVIMEDTILPADYLSSVDPDGLRQVNVMLPAGSSPSRLLPGNVTLRLECRGEPSAPVEVLLA
jgi:tRNA (mo5U34)-methyltransferase